MRRSRRTRPSSPELTELELSLLIELRRRHRATADQLRRELPWPSGAYAVRAALLRLEERSLIAHFISLGQIFYRCSRQPDSNAALSWSSQEQETVSRIGYNFCRELN